MTLKWLGGQETKREYLAWTCKYLGSAPAKSFKERVDKQVMLEMYDLKKEICQLKKQIEEYKLKELQFEERLQQQQLQITHYKKTLQKQAVVSADKLQDDLAKSKQDLLRDLSDRYVLGTNWGYDDISGEIHRDNEE